MACGFAVAAEGQEGYEMLLTLSLIFSMSELAGEDLILHYWVIVMKMARYVK